MKEKIVLAYSGGLDTLTMVKWLQKEKGYEVVTFTADLGQQIDLNQVEADEANFVLTTFQKWQETKQELVDFLESVEDCWNKEFGMKEELGYLG